MNCSNIRERLSAYLDGELDNREVEAVFTHLDGCQACQKELEELEATTAFVSDHIDFQLKSFELDHLYNDVMDAIESDEKERVTIKGLFYENVMVRFFKGVMSYAPTLASVAAILILTFGVMSQMESEQPKTAPQQNVSVDSLEYSRFNAMIYKTKEKNKTVIWLFKQEQDDDIDDPI